MSVSERITHGRHCTCSACASEDWTHIISPCGMHGPSCPRVYAPLGPAGTYTPLACDDAEWIARLEQTFPPDALERLTRAEYDYYSTHGDYLPGLAKLALHYRQQRDMLSHRADWKHPDDYAVVNRQLDELRGAIRGMAMQVRREGYTGLAERLEGLWAEALNQIEIGA